MTKGILASGLLAATLLASSTDFASALDRRVNIINNSSYDIVGFFASNKGTRSWEENIFYGSYLSPGYEVVVNIDDRSGYCKYDLRAVFSDGAEAIKYGVNVCEVVDFYFND